MEERPVVGMIGGRYRLHGLLGEGGMARVFDAFDERLERPVAVKILRPETAALPGMRKRFEQEARLSARLIHQNVVAVLDYGEDGAASYLVAERLPGQTLRDEIARGPMAPPRVAALMAETLGALAAAHKCGVLHRDIKPSNILLDEDGHARITDFGIAKSFDLHAADDPTADLTMTGVVLGTPGYLAPERRVGHPATVQSDLYSVGAVMVETLSGRRPVPGAEGGLHVAPEFRPLVTRALAAEPRQRFTSADEMLQALRPTRRSAPQDAPRASVGTTVALPAAPTGTSVLRTPPAAPRRAPRRRWSRILLPALAVALVAALLAWFLVSRGPAATPTAAKTTRTTVVRHHSAATRDPERTAITQLATSLASDGLPGDGALAAALDATAAKQPGGGRDAAAEESLALAGVLLAGGGITEGQFQDVATVLQPTGATVPTTTTTTPTTVPAPTPPEPGGHGHGFGVGNGPGFGP